MKKLILFLFVINSFISAQNEQSIELPDFIITGRQNVDVAAAQKPKPELISILSKDFFTPQYSSEDLPFLISSAPVPIIPEIKTSNEIYNGNLKISVGKYTLPVGELNYALNSENYLLSTKIWGTKIDEYIPFAGYNNSGFSLNNDFFISTRSEFLPGSKFSINADYWRDSYYFYGSNTPNQLRETNNASAAVSFQHLYGRLFDFAFDVKGDLLNLNENDFGETNLKATGLIEMKWNKLVFGTKGFFQRQTLQNNLSGINSYNFLTAEAYLFTSPVSSIWFKAGVYFNTNEVKTFFSPYGSVEILLDKGLTFGVEYKPHVDFLTTRNLLNKNIYHNLSMIDNLKTEYNNNVLGQFRFEYERSLTLTLSLNYMKIDNYPYFQDVTSPGKFDLFTCNGVSVLKSKLSLLFNSVLGMFSGEAVYQNVNDSNDNALPYESKFYSSVSYKYLFNFGLGIGIGYHNSLGAYTDLTNTDNLVDNHTLSASLEYEILTGIKLTCHFQNIMNRSNFAWKQYLEKPFDYLVGVEYRW